MKEQSKLTINELKEMTDSQIKSVHKEYPHFSDWFDKHAYRYVENKMSMLNNDDKRWTWKSHLNDIKKGKIW